MEIKRFDHRTKVKTRLERQNLQAASQLCTKQVGTGEINQIIESLLKVITNGHLLICDWYFRILKGSKMQSLDSDKRCC